MLRKKRIIALLMSIVVLVSNVIVIQAKESQVVYSNDFEEIIWENTPIGNSVIAEGGSSGATLEHKEDIDENWYMYITGNKSGAFRVSKLTLPSDPLSGAQVKFDWMPISTEASDSRFGDISFISSGNTYPYFGLQFDRNMKIKYYTIGENVAKGYGLTYSEETLEGGFKRNSMVVSGSAIDSGLAADTGIIADGSTWYTINIEFDYNSHEASLEIIERDNPETVLYKENNIPIYASAINPSTIAAGCWKGNVEMGIDNLEISYHSTEESSIVSVVQPSNVKVVQSEWDKHVSERPSKAFVSLADGREVELKIGEWTSSPEFDRDLYTVYTWTAPIIIPDDSDIKNPKNLSITYQTDYVKKYFIKGAYDSEILELDFGEVHSMEEFELLRPTHTQVILNNGEIVMGEIDQDSWTPTLNTLPSSYEPDPDNHPIPDVAPEFDYNKEGIYIYKAKLKDTDDYIIDGEIWVEWRVNYFSYKDNFNGYKRSIENLDRGVYAINNLIYDSSTETYIENTEGGVFLSWRILVDEYKLLSEGHTIAFDIYRNGEKITSLENITNYLDEGGEVGDRYFVKTTQKGETTSSKEVKALEENYISIELQRPLPSYGQTDKFAIYRLNDTEVGDVDGDGEYEIIVKWYPNNGFDPGSSSSAPSSPHIIDIYELDGTALWRLFMGYSSPAGQHFDNFIVYDLDKDGKAELSILTQDGTRTYRPDENGKFAYLTTEVGGYVYQSDDLSNSESTGQYILSDNGIGYVLSNSEGYDFPYVGSYGSPMMDDRYLIDEVGNRELEGVGVKETGFKGVEVAEYFTIFNGETGEIIDTVDYYYSTEFFLENSDNTINKINRYNIGLAYIPAEIDDESCVETIPAVLCNRAYYSDVSMIAYTLVDGKISTAWSTYIPTASNGGGNHNIVTGDMDNDGFDEVYLGGTAIDHDGTVLWAKNGFDNMDFMKHGDMIHMTAVFPDSDQLYTFTPVEDKSVSLVLNYALSNAATGARIVGHTFGEGDTGRGMLANVTPEPGYELWSSVSKEDSNGKLSKALYNAYGYIVSKTRPSVQTWKSYWDGDLLSELPDSNPAGGGDKSGLPMGVHKYNWETGETETIASFEGTLTSNSSKNNPNLIADILGDWREEILVRSIDNEELRIYLTNIPTEYTIYILMHDSVYRNAIANQNSTYNQPAHTSFYLGEDEEGRNRVLNYKLPTYNYSYTSELSNNENIIKEYAKVTFVNSNGTEIEQYVEVEVGNKVSAPVGINRAGYKLVGWYQDADLTEPWNFINDIVTKDITLYARWSRINSSTSDKKESKSEEKSNFLKEYPASNGDSSGWRKDYKGWWLQDENSYAKNEWKLVDENWYFFDETGYMATGWKKLDNDNWYWMDQVSGKMLENDWVFYQYNWYYLGTSGKMLTGWIQYNNIWYYLSNESNNYLGHMLSNAITPDGYLVNDAGEWIMDR